MCSNSITRSRLEIWKKKTHSPKTLKITPLTASIESGKCHYAMMCRWWVGGWWCSVLCWQGSPKESAYSVRLYDVVRRSHTYTETWLVRQCAHTRFTVQRANDKTKLSNQQTPTTLSVHNPLRDSMRKRCSVKSVSKQCAPRGGEEGSSVKGIRWSEWPHAINHP